MPQCRMRTVLASFFSLSSYSSGHLPTSSHRREKLSVSQLLPSLMSNVRIYFPESLRRWLPNALSVRQVLDCLLHAVKLTPNSVSHTSIQHHSPSISYLLFSIAGDRTRAFSGAINDIPLTILISISTGHILCQLIT